MQQAQKHKVLIVSEGNKKWLAECIPRNNVQGNKKEKDITKVAKVTKKLPKEQYKECNQ